jgi:hypothetical protein
LLVFLAMTSVAAQEAGEAVDADRGATPDGELSVEGAGHSSRPGGKGPGLDALLHLPTGFVTTEPDAVAGAGEGEWRRRFTKADRELLEARASLEDTKRELEGVADSGGGSQWSIAPPGSDSSPTTSPLSFKLREKLREGRDQIEVREKAMRGLRIEADLAGVPQSWRVAISNPTEAPRN